MSTSSLSALPSAYALTSDPIPSQEAPRARKTYGRKRDASPPIDTEGPSLSALFNTASSPRSDARAVRESPSKALLNRWSTGDASWKTSRKDLGMDKDDDDEPIDPAEIERELALMRGKARGEKSSPKRVELPPPTYDVAPRKFQVAKTTLQATISSSELSAAPSTSPLRSSPPRSSAPVHVNRVSSPSPRRPSRPPALANLFDTSSDKEDDTTERRDHSSTPVSRRSVTPTPGAEPNSQASQSATASPSSDTANTPIIRKTEPKARKSRLEAFMTDLDSHKQDAQTPTPPRHSSRAGSSPNVVTDFMATLQQSDDEDEEILARAKAKSSQAALDPVGLFDEEEEERDRAVRSGKTKVKGLAKKDLNEMQKDIAKAQRERHYEPFKTETNCLPISAWAMSAAAILKKPELVKDHGSPMSSPMQVTPPDEITAFTPSSTSRPDVKGPRDTKRTMVPGTSSPTPIVLGMHKAEGSDDDEYEVAKPLKGFMETVAEERAKADQAEVIEARRRVLARRKQEHMRTLKWTSKGRDNGDSDDELSIMPKPQTGVRFANAKPSAGPRTARSVLEKYYDATSGGKHRPVATQFAGKRSVKEEVTETMAEFAGKTFKHADMRTMNGGSRPAGQKANRDKIITQAHLDAMTMKEHQRQALRIQQKKEEAFGVRKRPLPTRQTQDLEAQIEALRAREAARFEEPEKDDEDAEDGDYQGSEEEEDEVEVEAEDLLYSGEEDNVDKDSEGAGEEQEPDNVIDTEAEADKENEMTTASNDLITVSIEEDSSPIKPRQMVPNQATPRPFREPLAELRVDQANAHQELENTFVDISGFGSGGGSPGFSQLFEATQAAGPSQLVSSQIANAVRGTDDQDAFAGLRDQHAGLLPANALLPQVDITATQIERDNAVIAADAEGDDAASFEERPRTQYMNERGYFTQTKPQPRPAVSASSSRDLLAGSSAVFDFAPEEVSEVELSSTQRDTSEGELAGNSATQSESPQRQRSPSSTDSDDNDDEMADEQSSRPVDAFAKLMAADQRPLTKHQQQAKARIRSNLVDEQADESDEDNWLMPGQTKDEEDDEDEDLDTFLPGLVNDEEVSEEERRRQDALVAAKNREILLADDARREAEARKVTEGQYRTKRRGKDFYSDDEDEGSSKTKRWSKKQRRARKEWKEDGLDKLDGEENVFMKLYEQDLDSDVESVDEAPSPRAVVQSPVTKTRLSENERREAIRKVAQMNKVDYEEDDIDLDAELGLGRSMNADDDTDTEAQEETQYSVSRMQRSAKVSEASNGSKLSIRSTESYQNFVRDESQTTRRVGAIGAASVVYNKKEILPTNNRFGGRPYNGKPPTRSGTGSSSSGSILLSKTNRFA